ncbi:MAG: hypothetical protein NUW37_01445 [Planctomycetes bacterium]|nr:hypothetical protein [Planctomycetota bacterium]
MQSTTQVAINSVDCPGCGARLAIPGGLAEQAEFICARCRIVLVNNEHLRKFRWMDQDEYVRKHGASRVNLWGGTLGSVIWLPIFFTVVGFQGKLTFGFAAMVAVPYLAMIWWMMKSRADASATLWQSKLFASIGVYFVYLGGMLWLVPEWNELFASFDSPNFLAIIGMGITFAAMGTIGALMYASKAKKLPAAETFEESS